jgi:EmrB/QacA subfamily drug resistance transporter
MARVIDLHLEAPAARSDATTRWLVLAVVSAAQFLCVLDLWVVNIALPAVQRDFASANLSDVIWILNVYTILLATLVAPAGRVADSRGRRALFLASLALFGVASMGCALAPTLAVLIAWRALQAVGAAVLMPTSLGLALPAFAPHERGTAVGVWAAVGAVAAGGGPVLGGLLVEANWRWIFLINVPLVCATFAAGWVLLPRDAARLKQRVDVVGTLLVLAATALVCAGLIQAAVWPALVSWSMVGAGLVLALIFARHVRRHPAPVVSPRMFHARRFAASTVGMLTYFVGFAAVLLGTTLVLTEHLHMSAVEAALAIAPGPIISGICSLFYGRLAGRIDTRKLMLAGAGLFAIAGAWPLVSAGEQLSYAVAILPSMVLWGVANALIMPTLFAAADAVPRADAASGAAVLIMARQLGSALGVALLVLLLGAGNVAGLVGVRYAWGMVIVSGVMTAAAGLFADRKRAAFVDDVVRPADSRLSAIQEDRAAA